MKVDIKLELMEKCFQHQKQLRDWIYTESDKSIIQKNKNKEEQIAAQTGKAVSRKGEDKIKTIL